MKLLLFFIVMCFAFATLPVKAQETFAVSFIRTHCNASCNTISFKKPGMGPHCSMPLINFDSIRKYHKKKYGVQELKEDFKIFRTVLEESHPALYWHISQDSLNKAFTEGFSLLSRPMNITEFHSIIRSFYQTSDRY